MATPWWLGTIQVPTDLGTAQGSEAVEVDKRTGQRVYRAGTPNNQTGPYYYTMPSGGELTYEDIGNAMRAYISDRNPGELAPGQDEAARTATFVTDAAKGLAAPYGNLGGEVGVIDGRMSYLYPMDRGATIDGDLGVYGGAQRARWTSPSQSKGTVVKGPDGNFWVAPPADARFSESDTADHTTMLQGAWRDFGPIIMSAVSAGALSGGESLASTFGGGVTGAAAAGAATGAGNALLSGGDVISGAIRGGLNAGAGNVAGNMLQDSGLTSGAISLPVSDPGIVESFPLSEYTAPDVGSSGLTVASEAANNAAIDSSLGGGMEGYPSATEGDVLAQLPQRPNVTDPSDGLGPSPFKSNIPDTRLNPLDIKRGMLQAMADSGIPAEIWQNLPAGISTAQTIAKLAPYFGDSSGPLSAYAKMLSEAKTPAIIDSTSSALGQMNSALTTDEGKYPSPIKPYLQPQTLSTGPLGQTPPMFQGIDPKLIAQMDRRGYAMGGPVNPVEYVAGPEDRYYARHQKRGFAVNGPGTGQSDDIPTMLADGEYVIDSDTVAALGDGSSKAGASVLDKFREEIRQHKRSAPVNAIPPKARDAMQYLKEAQKGKKNG